MEYLRLLPYHNLNRWIVLLAASWVLAQSWHGFLCRRKWTRNDTLAGLTFTTIANLQFILGLFLYVTSPYVKPLFTAAASAFSSEMAFFLTTFHPAVMILTVGLAQAVYSATKRTVDDRKKFYRATCGYSFTVVLMLAAIPWPFYSFGRPFIRPFTGIRHSATEIGESAKSSVVKAGRK